LTIINDQTPSNQPAPFNGDNLDINPPQTSLDVVKDMNFGLSAANGGQVEISQVAQSFHQVPEPSTVAMLLIGSAVTLFVCARRRRRA
jgi:PEP-CTERM motif